MSAPPAGALRVLRRYVGPQWPRAALLAVLLLLTTALELAGPQIMRRFIDTAYAGAASGALQLLAGLFLLLALINQALALTAKYLSENVGLTATNWLRGDLVRHCLQLDMTFFGQHSPGELIDRVDGDVAALGNFFSQFVIRLLGSGLLLAGLIIVVALEFWQIGLLITIFIGLVFGVAHTMQQRIQPALVGERQSAATIYGFLEERLSGLRDIRSSGAQAYVQRRFLDLARAFYRAYLRGQFLFGITLDMITTLFMAIRITTLASGAYLLISGRISLGTVVLLYSYTELLERPMAQIMEQVGDFQKASASLTRIQELFRQQSAISERPTRQLPAGPLAVRFDRVSFRYSAGETVLRDISFGVAAGKTLGVLGRTGSGKTTLSRLLFRLYDPSAGAILLGGADLRDLALGDIRQRISLVTQDVQLFRASVRDNLTFFDGAIADERILAVLGEIGLWEWYQALPQGLDTMLEAGDALSAGEAQLLAITRAFLKDPGLVLLDEASSRLDPRTEQRLERAIRRLLQGRTVIIIAHRLSTVEQVDDILVLAEGTVHEYGSRQELAARPDSRYARLLATGIEEPVV